MQRLRLTGNPANVADKPMALTPEQLYKLGAEALGWNTTTAAGKAVIAEDMKLLKRLYLDNAIAADGSLTCIMNRKFPPNLLGYSLVLLLHPASLAPPFGQA